MLRYFFVLNLGFFLLRAAAPQPKLAIVNPMLHDSEDGPPVPSDYKFAPGDTVYFSFQVSGYKKTEDNKIDVAYEMNARDPEGVLLAPPDVGSVGTTLSDEDKKWLPKVRYSFVVPGFAETGNYRIEIKLRDRFGGTEADLTEPFAVAGKHLEPSDKLVIRDFRFLRTEEDKNPVEVAAYRPGDTLWARFDLTGYKLGDENAFDVEYGVSILRSDGTVSYSQDHAAEEKDKSFYPQRYTPGVVSIHIPPDLARGAYTLVIAAKDDLSGATAEVRRRFTVE